MTFDLNTAIFQTTIVLFLHGVRSAFLGKDHGHLALKNAPAYFFTPDNKKYVLGPGLDDQSDFYDSPLKLILDQDAEPDRGCVIQSKAHAP